jgi:cytochrome c553
MSPYRLAGVAVLMLSSMSLHAEQHNPALLAAACAACHGTNGHSVGGTPSLAGLDAHYFIDQMHQFQRGDRKSTVMMQHAKGYSEKEIRQLADFFAHQK